ncbi:hypothetical protein RUM43_012650 [Polyplax serrata]|uniref:Uncharacterized protein n=1 Tax=Polyplax serrata TaxID=468196 RepID=A0AAN8S404_POLSC
MLNVLSLKTEEKRTAGERERPDSAMEIPESNPEESRKEVTTPCKQQEEISKRGQTQKVPAGGVWGAEGSVPHGEKHSEAKNAVGRPKSEKNVKILPSLRPKKKKKKKKTVEFWRNSQEAETAEPEMN